jgi:hypothetical protein
MVSRRQSGRRGQAGAQDAAHKTARQASQKRKAKGKAEARNAESLKEAERQAANPQGHATAATRFRRAMPGWPRPVEVVDFAVRTEDAVSWPADLEEWRHFTADTKLMTAKWKRLHDWHSWDDKDNLRGTDRFQGLLVAATDGGDGLVCAHRHDGVRCGEPGLRREGTVRCTPHRRAEREASQGCCGAAGGSITRGHRKPRYRRTNGSRWAGGTRSAERAAQGWWPNRPTASVEGAGRSARG